MIYEGESLYEAMKNVLSIRNAVLEEVEQEMKNALNTLSKEELSKRNRLEQLCNEFYRLNHKEYANVNDESQLAFRKCSLKISAEYLDDEIANITNMINFILKYNMVKGANEFRFTTRYSNSYRQIIEIHRSKTLGVMEVIGEPTLQNKNLSIADCEVYELSIPNNVKNIDIGADFIYNQNFFESKRYYLILRVKSLKQLYIPIELIKDMISSKKLKLYVDGELFEVDGEEK